MSEPARAGGRIAVAITGASGALHAERTRVALSERECEVELVATCFGWHLLRDEPGDAGAIGSRAGFLADCYGDAAGRGRFTIDGNRDLGAPPASGSHASPWAG
jgi:3-polyprenyl-4-hydroxybenzoate decarboxylase